MLRKCVALLALCVLVFSAGCTGGAFPDLSTGLPESPSREHMEAMAKLLPPQQAKELLVYWDEHNDLIDSRVHTKHTCPFLVWMPKKAEHDAGTMSDLKWAKFMHEFYRYKHKEEGDCDCDELLGRADPVAEPVAEPKAEPPPAVKPDRGSADKDDDDGEDAIKEIIKDWLKKKAAELDVKPK